MDKEVKDLDTAAEHIDDLVEGKEYNPKSIMPKTFAEECAGEDCSAKTAVAGDEAVHPKIRAVFIAKDAINDLKNISVRPELELSTIAGIFEDVGSNLGKGSEIIHKYMQGKHGSETAAVGDDEIDRVLHESLNQVVDIQQTLKDVRTFLMKATQLPTKTNILHWRLLLQQVHAALDGATAVLKDALRELF